MTKSDNLKHRQSLSLPLQLVGQRILEAPEATQLQELQELQAWQAPYFHMTRARAISKCKSVAKERKNEQSLRRKRNIISIFDFLLHLVGAFGFLFTILLDLLGQLAARVLFVD